jgi:DNA-binding CsgD family transcriptional regulator
VRATIEWVHCGDDAAAANGACRDSGGGKDPVRGVNPTSPRGNPAANRPLLDRYYEIKRRNAECPLSGLAEPERTLLTVAAEGHTSSEIDKCISLSPRTVDSYCSRLMRRRGLQHRANPVRFAM